MKSVYVALRCIGFTSGESTSTLNAFLESRECYIEIVWHCYKASPVKAINHAVGHFQAFSDVYEPLVDRYSLEYDRLKG